MKDQVVVTNSGELCVAIPLYRSHNSQSMGKFNGYTLEMFKDEPLAFVLEGPGICQVFNADFVFKNSEFIGPLEDEPTPQTGESDV